MKEYAIYKGEKLLFIGTSEECAEHFGVTRKTVYFWATPANKKRAEFGVSGNRKKECSGVKVAEKI